MFNIITPFESVHALIMLTVAVSVIAVGIYYGNKARQEYILKKTALEQEHNKTITGMNIAATHDSKSIDLQTLNAKTALKNANTDPQLKEFPRNVAPASKDD